MESTGREHRKSALSRKDWMVLLVTAAVIVLVFASGILDRQQTWADMNFKDVYIFPSMNLNIEEGAQYGICSGGPGYSLPQGRYRLRLTVETDGGGSVALTSSNHGEITPSGMTFDADEPMPALDFEIRDAVSDFEIKISFDSGTYMNVYDIRLYTPFYRDHAFTFAFILAGLVSIVLLYRTGRIGREGIETIILLTAAVMVSSAPVLKDNIVKLIDLEFHMARIENLADGLRSGQFPVRAGGFTFNGYGAITSIFYPDLLLVPIALLRLAGASPTYVVSVFCIMCSTLSAVFAYFAGKRMFGSRMAGICAGILYVCCSYRLNNLIIRGALGEGLAMSFYPLFILGLWETVYGDARRWRILSMGAFLIFMSHLITTVMAAMMAVFICALSLPRLVREHRISALLKAIAATVCISAFFLVPMLDMMRQGINGDIINMYQLQDKTIAPAQLLLQSRGLLQELLDPTVDTGAVELGLPIVIGIMLIFLALFSSDPDARMEKKEIVPLAVMTAAGLMFAFMTTTLFPWSYVSVVTGFFNRIQFAWRFLGPSVALLSLCSGCAYARIAGKRGLQLPVLLLSFALLFILPTLSEQSRRGSFYRFGEGTGGNIIYDEYQLPGSDLHKTLDRTALESEPGILSDYRKEGTRITAVVTGGGTVEFPLFAFDGYVAELNGQSLPVERGSNNRIRVVLPENAAGTLEISYRAKTLWRMIDVFSLLSFAAVFLWPVLMRKRQGV